DRYGRWVNCGNFIGNLFHFWSNDYCILLENIFAKGKVISTGNQTIREWGSKLFEFCELICP
ncbi:unnamed protein product, partial [Allacma fusca]